jgi:hypothetical protein
MKSRLGLLVATLTFALAIVFAGYGYNHKTLGGYVAKESAGPMVSFDAYSRMDKKRDRSAAFAKESPHNKSLLWRQHLAYYEARMQLNDQQKEFLKRVSEFLDERFFAAPIGMSEAKYVKTKRGKPFKELMQNVSKLFTPEQSRQLFLTVGDTSTITDWGCPLLNATVNDPSAAKAKGPDPGNNPNVPDVSDTCNCTGSFCGSGCDANSNCRFGNCDEGGSCGCFGWFNCTAWCFPIQ